MHKSIQFWFFVKRNEYRGHVETEKKIRVSTKKIVNKKLCAHKLIKAKKNKRRNAPISLEWSKKHVLIEAEH